MGLPTAANEAKNRLPADRDRYSTNEGAMTPTNDLLTVKEVAVVLRMSVGRVQQLLAAGHIRGARRLGRAWLIPSPITIVPNTRVTLELRDQIDIVLPWQRL